MGQNIPSWIGKLVGVVLAVSLLSATLSITQFYPFEIIISWSVLRTTRRTAATFSDSSTKHIIEHLCDIHRIGKEGPIEAALEQGEVLLETAVGKTRPDILFNRAIFRNLLLRWLIVNNLSFLNIEQDSFRVLVNYLLVSVCCCPLLQTPVRPLT